MNLIKRFLRKINWYFEEVRILLFPRYGSHYQIDDGYVAQGTYTKVCIFSSFDIGNVIEDYVFNYIQKLKENEFEVIFVSTSKFINEEDFHNLKKLAIKVIKKQNIGLDFASWKVGIESILDLNQYEQLLLANDSVYYLKEELDDFFKMLMPNEILGMTNSFEIKEHIQSYFLLFGKDIFTSNHFYNFFNNVKFYRNKEKIIRNYEIELQSFFESHGFKVSSLIDIQDFINNHNLKINTNLTLDYWNELLLSYDFPVLKTRIIKDGITNEELSLLPIDSKTMSFIKKHKKRMADHDFKF